MKILHSRVVFRLCAFAGLVPLGGSAADPLTTPVTSVPLREGAALIFALIPIEQLQKRAEEGEGAAQVLLADRYYRGDQKLKKDPIAAYKWASVAMMAGHRDAKHVVAEFDLFMSDREKREGRRQAEAHLAERSRSNTRVVPEK